MTEGRGDAAAGGARATGENRERSGWWRRFVRRLVLAALDPELGTLRAADQELRNANSALRDANGALHDADNALRDANEGLRADHRVLDDTLTRLVKRSELMAGELSALVSRAAATDLAVQEQAAHVEELARSSGEFRTHAETRLDQTAEEVGDLRGAFLAARGDLEALRDGRLPELERRLDGVAADAITALQREMETVRDQRVPRLEDGIATAHRAVESLQAELAGLRQSRLERDEQDLLRLQAAVTAIQESLAEVRDRRLTQSETATGRIQGAVEALQTELEELRGGRLGAVEADLAALHEAQQGVQRLAEEVRDERLPALADRTDALLARLHEELVATGGLLDRLIAGEPLRVVSDPVTEAALPEAFRASSARFLQEFRGSEAEIAGRVEEYLPLLESASPVLDLGCGRGELLLALRGAGVAASGVDSDPAMVDACHRAGLQVEQADLLAAVVDRPPASLGAITAVHVLEHLPAATWMSVVAAAARALRPGGVLIVESPNPESLRVGAGLFWVDPTHRAPIHADAVAFVARAVGLEVVETRFVRPFPTDQLLARADQPAAVRLLAERLDTWLSGPRDFAVIARKADVRKTP